MAVILDFITQVFQAHLPHDSEYIPDTRAWWINPSLWRYPLTASCVQRPTEDTALRFIEDESRALRHQQRHLKFLSADEHRLLALERECMREHPACRYPFERASWVANRMSREKQSHWSAWNVKLALEDLTEVILQLERDHVVEVIRQWDQRVIDRRERERADRASARAA